MAIALVNTFSVELPESANTGDFPTNGVGNLIVVTITVDGDTIDQITSITSDNGFTSAYTRAALVEGAGDVGDCEIWWATVLGVGTEDLLIISPSGFGTTLEVVVSEFSGLGVGESWNIDGSPGEATGNAAEVTWASPAPAGSGELFVGVANTQSNYSTFGDPDGTYTALNNNVTVVNVDVAGGYRPVIDLDPSCDYASLFVLFSTMVPPPPPPPVPSEDMGVPLSYRCYDYDACSLISVLPFTKVTFGQTVSKDDTFTGTLVLSDPRMKNLAWERATRRYCATLFISDGTPTGCPWGGLITNRKYSSKDHTLVVTATTFGCIGKQRLQAADYTTPNPDATYWSVNPNDPTVVAAQVVEDMLAGSLTMSDAINAFCNPCGTTQVKINSAAIPTDITGCTSYGILQESDTTVYLFGRNGCVEDGTLIADYDDVNIVAGTTVSSFAVGYDAIAETNGSTVGAIAEGFDTITDVVAPYELFDGMLIDALGLPIGTTITDLSVPTISGGTYTYATVTVSAAATGTHANVTATIGGYYTVVMSADPQFIDPPPTVARKIIHFVNWTSTPPTDPSNWVWAAFSKSLYQTVDTILTNLANMGFGVGFDYSWDCAFGDGMVPKITLNIETPRKGRVWPGSGVVIDLQQATEYTYTEDGKNQAIGLVEQGSGMGGTQTATAADESLIISGGYVPTEAATSHTQTTDAKQLTGLLKGDWAANVWPSSTLVVTLPLILYEQQPGQPNPPGIRLGSLNVGDDVLAVINEGNQPTPGLPQDPRFLHGLSFVFEMQAWKATIAEKGRSTVELTLGVPPVAIDAELSDGEYHCTAPPEPPTV